MKKFNLKLIIFSVLIFSLLSSSQVFGAKLGELLDRAAKSGIQEAMTPLVREAERLAKEFEQGKKKLEEVTRNITPTQALNVVSTATNLPSSVKDFFQKIIEVGTKPSTSQTSSSKPSSQPSTQPSPTQLIKPEGASSLSEPSSSSSQQPTQQPSNAQLLQEFRELESQSMQQTTTTTRTTHKIEKVKRYYCNRTTAQCVYSVYNAIPQYDKPPYYKTLAECQANCKKAPYVCYRYVLSTGCSMQCTPYASDTPCKNECTPSGTPIQGTAQQQQTSQQQQQTGPQQNYYCSNVCYQGRCTSGYFSMACSNLKSCRRDADCGGVTSPSTNTTYWCNNICRGDKCISSATVYPCSNYKSCRTDADCRSTASQSSSSSSPSSGQPSSSSSSSQTCSRQEGECSSSSNCLSCPSGYYKKSGGCSCTCGTPKRCSCYIVCCRR